MPLPLIPILAGKAVFAGAIALSGHRLARRFQRPSHYASAEPVFVPSTMLKGCWHIEGLAHGARGRVVARLTGAMEGQWHGQHGSLDIHLSSDTGQRWDHKIAMHLGDNGAIAITGDTLTGPGEGVASGNSLRLRYPLTLPQDRGGWTLDAEDWIFAMPSGRLAYQGQYHKLGWPVGSFSAMLTPAPQ